MFLTVFYLALGSNSLNSNLRLLQFFFNTAGMGGPPTPLLTSFASAGCYILFLHCESLQTEKQRLVILLRSQLTCPSVPAAHGWWDTPPTRALVCRKSCSFPFAHFIGRIIMAGRQVHTTAAKQAHLLRPPSPVQPDGLFLEPSLQGKSSWVPQGCTHSLESP